MGEQSDGDVDRYLLCMSCGCLKHELMFEVGDCTCKDCYAQNRPEVRYKEASDGEGYVRVE